MFYVSYYIDIFPFKFRLKALDNASNFISPVDLLFKLDEHLPDKTILIADGGDFVATAAYILRYVYI